jgi:peptide/nickel transport system permease protein
VVRRILIRVAVATVTLWAASVAVFLGVEALPGDAATAALGRSATPELVAGLRQQYGLDRPATERYVDWLRGVLHGDLGRSLPSGDEVSVVIGDKIRNTAVLALATVLVLVPLSLLFGILSAVGRDGLLDLSTAAVTLALISTPEFVIGSLLAVALAVWVAWLPPVSLIDPGVSLLSQSDALVLPVLTLVAASVAQSIRMVRACMIDVLRSDYIEMVRLRGVSERELLLRHALPNALGPVVQVFAIIVAWLAGGIVVVEAVFQYPGIGSALTGAVQGRDLPTVQAITLLVTAVYVIVNLLADVAIMLLNPRLRRAGRA